MASYYNLPQAPGKYQDMVMQAGGNVYDDVEEHRSALYGYVCGLPVIAFAYAVCAYMMFEGLILILDVEPDHPRFGLKGPFSNSETGFLDVVAWGDIVAAVIGAVGIWFSHNLLPVGWRNTSKLHSTMAMLGTGIVLAWRSLVCLSFAPWAGIVLAFSTPDGDRVFVYAFILGYIALSIFLVYVLAMAFRQAVSDGKRFQQHSDAQALRERQQLLISASNHRRENRNVDGEDLSYHEVEPELFGFMPLAETVTIYSIVIAVACVWCIIHLVITGHTSGGWAFFSKTPEVASTFWLEVFLWPLSFICALIGMSGASSFSGAGFLDEKPALSSLLVFLIGSMLRFGLLFAVTGMDLLEKNTCGFYLSGLSKVAYTSAPGMSLHCVPMEYLLLAGVLLCCILDGYLIWGTFQLWHHAQNWRFGSYAKESSDYGAAPCLVLEDDQWMN